MTNISTCSDSEKNGRKERGHVQNARKLEINVAGAGALVHNHKSSAHTSKQTSSKSTWQHFIISNSSSVSHSREENLGSVY
jgi:hypothetical protein